jgi:tRNA nucleotidyltransferase/poly(A) polymerase
MDEAGLAEAAGAGSYIVGGAIRDELLGRPVFDVDVACRDPRGAARKYSTRAGGAVFALSERHGAWRVAFPDERTVDFTPLLDGIEQDLRTRDFTINAIARRLGEREYVDPLEGRGDLKAGTLRAVSESVFRDDPLRLLRAVRLEDELGFSVDPATEELVRRDAAHVTQAAGERILGELQRLSPDGWRRLDDLGLLSRLGGSAARFDGREAADHPDYPLVVALGESLFRLPVSNETRRFGRALLRAKRPPDDSARAIHRFRRTTEPWALEALAFLGAPELYGAVRRARATEPAEPLLRGDELGIPPGPEVGRILERIAEERAAGTISTREEALELARDLRT